MSDGFVRLTDEMISHLQMHGWIEHNGIRYTTQDIYIDEDELRNFEKERKIQSQCDRGTSGDE